ncbi:MAG: DUF5615 family PIN-like protein [Bradymonadaceae bacterium]
MRERVRQQAGFERSGTPVIVDENISPSVAVALRERGYNVRHHYEITGGQIGIPDPPIDNLARILNARVLTRDRGSQLNGGFDSRAIQVDSRVSSPDAIERLLKSSGVAPK